MTKNYLRFLIDRIEVFDDRIEMQAKPRNAVALMAHPEPLEGGRWLRLLDSNRPEVLQSRGLIEESRADESTRIDVSPRELVAFGPNESEAVDNVEEALAFALAEAARAGNWDVVSQLARLLEARFAQTSTR